MLTIAAIGIATAIRVGGAGRVIIHGAAGPVSAYISESVWATDGCPEGTTTGGMVVGALGVDWVIIRIIPPIIRIILPIIRDIGMWAGGPDRIIQELIISQPGIPIGADTGVPR